MQQMSPFFFGPSPHSMLEANSQNNDFLKKCLEIYSKRNNCGVDEFESDIRLLVNIKRLLIKIKNNPELPTPSSIRLLSNHLRVLFNLFGTYSIEMLEYTIPEPYYDVMFAGLVESKLITEKAAIQINPESIHQIQRFTGVQ